MMLWNRSNTLAIAKNTCTSCHGVGLRQGRRGHQTVCNCTLRAIFRACYARFRYCAAKEKYLSKVSLEFTPGGERRMTWGRKDEEYVADFCLVSRRALDELEYTVFKFHFLLGADWKLCCHRLKMDRGTFFHIVYRIEQRLGCVFRDLKPYALYPLTEYFNNGTRGRYVRPCSRPDVIPIRLPAFPQPESRQQILQTA